MNMLLNKIKLLLYDLKIKKIVTILDKIDYLLLCDISLYDEPYRYIILNSLETDIYTYKAELKRINTYNLLSAYFPYTPKSSTEYVRTQAYLWMSSGGKIIDNPNYMLFEFLSEARTFIYNHEMYCKDFSNNYGYSNSIKLKPYIINLDYIINNLVDSVFIK